MVNETTLLSLNFIRYILCFNLFRFTIILYPFYFENELKKQNLWYIIFNAFPPLIICFPWKLFSHFFPALRSRKAHNTSGLARTTTKTKVWNIPPSVHFFFLIFYLPWYFFFVRTAAFSFSRFYQNKYKFSIKHILWILHFMYPSLFNFFEQYLSCDH